MFIRLQQVTTPAFAWPGQSRLSAALVAQWIGIAASCLISGPLQAQTQAQREATAASTSQDAILRQQQREQQLRQQQEQTPDARLPRDEVPQSERFPEQESPCFPINRIVLDGDLASHFQFALQSVIEGEDPAIGRCLGSQGISAVITRAQNAVIAKGYVTTRILAAPQDLNGGELVLTVIPGRINSIRFSPDADARATQ